MKSTLNFARWLLGLAVTLVVLAAAAAPASAKWVSMNVNTVEHVKACRDGVRFNYAYGQLPSPDDADPGLSNAELRLGILAGPGPDTPVPGDPTVRLVVDQMIKAPFALVLTPTPYNFSGTYTFKWAGAPLAVGSTLLYVFDYPDLAGDFIDVPEPGETIEVENCRLLDEHVAPSCRIVGQGRTPAGGASLTFEVRDEGSGLAATSVASSRNATVTSAYSHGTTAPVRITAQAVDPAASTSVRIALSDTAGNSSSCRALGTVVKQDRWIQAPQTFTGLSESQRRVLIQNGTPGLRNLALVANFRPFAATGLADGELRSLSIASAMRAGTNNWVALTPFGRPGGSAVVSISNTT